MGNRRWILYVLGVSLLVPLVIEGWTFYTMFVESYTGTTAPTDTGEPAYYGEGDEILPSTKPVEVLRVASIEDRAGEWVFKLLIDVDNTTDRSYRYELNRIHLQDGTPVELEASVSVDPGKRGTLSVGVPLSDGMIPRQLILEVGGSLRGRENVVVPLSSVPVRKYSD